MKMYNTHMRSEDALYFDELAKSLGDICGKIMGLPTIEAWYDVFDTVRRSEMIVLIGHLSLLKIELERKISVKGGNDEC